METALDSRQNKVYMSPWPDNNNINITLLGYSGFSFVKYEHILVTVNGRGLEHPPVPKHRQNIKLEL